MSDYVHKKAIRLPITESLMIRKIGFDDIEDFIEQLDQYINEKCPELYRFGNQIPLFFIILMVKNAATGKEQVI